MLEYVVRPFSSPGALGSTLIPSNPGLTVERAILKWGAQATMPAAKSSGVNVVCCNEGLNEQSRQTETVKISNPNDSSQFIMVKRAKSLSLKKTEDKNGCDAQNSFGMSFAPTNFSFSGDAEISAALDVPDTCQVKLTLKNT